MNTMPFDKEAALVYRNLDRNAAQIAHYLIARCGEFYTDGEREVYIAAFLREAAARPDAKESQ